MNLKKKLGKLLSFLLLLALSVTLFTGCTQEDAELALDVLNAVLETEVEEDVYEETTDIATEDAISGVFIPEETTSEGITSTETELEDTAPSEDTEPAKSVISEDGTYTSKEEVAEYLYTYGHLPSNFIKKKAAQKLGWVSKEGNLWDVAPGMSIGGDYFGNYEGTLPEAEDRDYYECDIDFDGSYRGAKRIVYSNDGLIYYTEDHYETFELLYGEE